MAVQAKERARGAGRPADGAGPSGSKPERRLFLIDGPSLVYRAFFALPESIATSTGVPTNAIFGFASMLVKIVTEYGVQPTVVAWDAGTSGRTELFADYKASRRSRPDLLKQQWPAMEPLVEAFGYTNVKLEGYEADDVIASLAERALRADPPVPVMIVTGDRDVFQLIDEDGLVKVMATSRGITETKIYDRQAVIDRYGIAPELIPDFYGLKGDTSDNIPGIPGIGDKTASELIQTFGTLEEVLAHVEQVKGAKRKQNLIEHAEDARLSKRARDRPARPRRRLRRRARGRRASPTARGCARSSASTSCATRCAAWRRRSATPTSRRRASAAEVTLTASLRAGAPADIAALGEQASEVCVVVRGGRAARGRAVRRGLAVALRARPPAGRRSRATARARRRSSRRAAGARSSRTTPRRCAPCPDGSPTTRCSAPTCSSPRGAATRSPSCARSAGWRATSRTRSPRRRVLLGALADWQREQIAERGLRGGDGEIELPLVPVLREMELLGVRLEPRAPRRRSPSACARRSTGLEREIFALAGEEFTIGSPQQLGRDPVRAARPLAQAPRQDRLLDRRARAAGDPRRARDRAQDRALARALDADQDLPRRAARAGRRRVAHPHDLPAGGRDRRAGCRAPTRTCRTSRSARRSGARSAAASRPSTGKVLISADYSQIELRVLAQAAGEAALMEIFKRGEDVHTATASRVFGVTAEEIDPGMRSKAKMINYGIVYGLSDYGLADRLNIPREEAKEFIDAYLERFPRVAAFMAATIERAKEEGYVKTLWGRRRQIPELRARNYQVRTLGERLAVNTVDPGHRRRHHQARDGAHATPRSRRRASRRSCS